MGVANAVNTPENKFVFMMDRQLNGHSKVAIWQQVDIF